MAVRIVSGEEGVAACSARIREGGIAGVPTETVYGLAADAFQPIPVASIFEAKGRPLTDPLIVHLPEAGWLDRVALLESSEERALVQKLASTFWPGPLTILLQKHPDIPDLVTAGSGRVAVRVTEHPLFQKVIRQVGSPLAAPSANRFGRISPVSAEDVRSELGEYIDVILDGGVSRHGLESTIISIRGEGIEILRPGPITEDQLREFGHITPYITRCGRSGDTPGSLPGHYAPRTELSIMETDISTMIPAPMTGLLSFRGPSPDVAGRFSEIKTLSPKGDLREAAAHFYSALRALDESGVTSILAERLPLEGIGVAIMDRLRRAEYGSKNGAGHSTIQ